MQKGRAASLGLLLLLLTSCSEKKLLLQGLTNPELTPLENFKKEDSRVDFKKGDLGFTITALGQGQSLLLKKTNFLRLTMEESERDQKAPYPGNVSHVIQCDPALKVRPKSLTSGSLHLSGYYHSLTERHALENCRPSEVKYRGFWGYLQCGTDGPVFEIKVSFPRSTADIDAQLNTFRCGS